MSAKTAGAIFSITKEDIRLGEVRPYAAGTDTNRIKRHTANLNGGK